MPVLRTSASDFTAWSRANAILPANGKAAKSTDTTVDRKAAAVVAIGSQSAIGATPSSAISKRWRIVPAVPAVKATLNASLRDSFIAKYDSVGKVQWVAKQGGTGNDYGNSVTVDSSGNIIVGGIFYDNLSIYNANGTVATTLTNSVSFTTFIAKYNSSGIVQWAAKQGGSAGSNGTMRGVTVDSSGNVIVVGYSSANPLILYNANGTPFGTTLANPDVYVSFIAKYNSSGIVQWVAKQGGTVENYAYGVTADSSGNVIVTGHFNSTTLTLYNANGTPFGTTLTNQGAWDSFIAKYDSAGTILWVAQQCGAGWDKAQAVTADSSGNVIMAGYFASTTLTLYNANGTPFGTTLTNTNSNRDGFIVKYNSAGTVLWAASQGGLLDDQAYAVTVDSSGNIIVAGEFNYILTLYSAGGTAFGTTLTSTGDIESFIAKYDSAGTVQWAAKQGGTGADTAAGVTADSLGNVIIGGTFTSDPLTLYNANGTPFGTTLTNPGGNDSFIAKYNSAGTVQWAAKQGGTGGSDLGNSVAADSSGNVIITGYFNSSTLTCYNSDGTDIITPEIPPSIVYYR